MSGRRHVRALWATLRDLDPSGGKRVAYDPTLTSFIVVAVVGGAAAVLNASSEWELSYELSRATERWTKLAVARVYEPAAAADRPAREAAILEAHGYQAVPDPTCGTEAVATQAGGTMICYRRSRTA
jgi:hypothetical protein